MYEIESLKSKKLPELQEMAKSSGIKKITGLKKMELIYQIIDTVASTPNEEKSKQSSIKEQAEHTFSSPYSQKKEANMHEKPQTKGEIKNIAHKGEIIKEHKQKNNHQNLKYNQKRKKDIHEINHNRDNRGRYREPDFEFEGIISTEGVLEMMQEGYGFLRSSDFIYLY